MYNIYLTLTSLLAPHQNGQTQNNIQSLSKEKIHNIHQGAIQVLRNADGGGRGSIFPGGNVTKV